MNRDVRIYNLKQIFDQETLAHLRIPFSFFLFPIFSFSLCFSENINWPNSIIVFICLHFFIYPGSNSYNSYMDKDEESIGGLKNPPPVSKKTYYASILLDVTGLLIAAYLSWDFVLALLVYIIVSKAYSWHGIRLKKFSFLSWFVVLTFQGGFTYFIVTHFTGSSSIFSWPSYYNGIGALIASLFVGAYYPLTQIYQHKEDSKRGDRTISRLLGIRGTFLFSFVILVIANIFMLIFLGNFYSTQFFILYSMLIYPVAFYFFIWFVDVIKDPENASFERTMHLNLVSAICMTTCFLILLILKENQMFNPFDILLK